MRNGWEDARGRDSAALEFLDLYIDFGGIKNCLGAFEDDGIRCKCLECVGVG